MQNLDKILDKILTDAREEAEKVLDAARQECETIEKESDARVQSVIEAAEARAAREETAAAQRANSTADMKKREILLAAKVGMLSKAFSEAENYLYDLSQEDYCVFLAHLLADAAVERLQTVQHLQELYGEEEACDGEFLLELSEKDRELGSLVIKAAKTFMKRGSTEYGKTNFTLAEESAPIRGGLILRYGDIASNCSVEAVINGLREQMEARIANILFPPESVGE